MKSLYNIGKWLCMKRLLFFLFGLTLFSGCDRKKKFPSACFTTLDETRTGIHFVNKLTPTAKFNVLDYMYFYNGAGIGAGDFNNDGKTDLFFAANQSQDQLYLNEGGMHFKNVTGEAQIPDDGGWSTGVSVVDINNDGLLDIYICRVGNYESLHSRNQLLVCQGIDSNHVPVYKDEAAAYGLDFSGFSTQAVFFDYDHDGDLDMFLLNHAVHQNGNFAPRKNFLGTYSELSGDRLYRNDGGHFTDVTRASGINSSAISYGLGVSVADINNDGWPDIYVGNDFHENDYLYINQHNGTFREEGTERMMHTSQFSMGVDVADLNNDGAPEIISMDMLPDDKVILKRSLGEDDYNLFNEKISIGYSYQYSRNNLQYNRRNGLFSETGLYTGIAASDWSWAPLFFDYDNDGLKDLFISNGIPKRMNDIDYVNFVSDEANQSLLLDTNKAERNMTLIRKFPEIKLPNKFYHNAGNLRMDDFTDSVDHNRPTYSNGAVYADLDNDGTLDLAVNNIDDPALIYQNKTHAPGKKDYVDIILHGSEKNIHAVGATVVLFVQGSIRTYEKYPVHGFLSSMEIPLHIGLAGTRVDSAFLIWPDNSFQRIHPDTAHTLLSFTYNKGLPGFNYTLLNTFYKNTTNPVTDITASSGFSFLHRENHFPEFDREPLIPHMLSTEGPALAVADVDDNGLEDIFIGGARNQRPGLFLQTSPGKFTRSIQPALDADSIYEDVDACFADINHDGRPDLVVASGGNEFYGNDEHNTPRVYLNDGHGHFSKEPDAFDHLYLTASSVAAYDFNGDGFTDLFIGARTVPWEYGQLPRSYLLMNDQHGHFKDVTEQYAPGLSYIGFVTQAQWIDINHDGRQDLLLALEWGSPTVFMNENGRFKKQELTVQKGWWNFLTPCDINKDGKVDFIAGNQGLNSRLKASAAEPVRLYYNDFDDNGKKEQILTYYLNGTEIPFANKMQLEKQMPVLKKKYLYAKDFASASLYDLFGTEKLTGATQYSADYFANALLLNKGDGQFEVRPLPFEAQLTSYKDAVVVNANNDSLPDLLLLGNYYDNSIELGRYDADFGTLLLNRGGGQVAVSSLNGLVIKGQVRRIRKIMLGREEAFVLARNNDSAMLIQIAGNAEK